MDYQISEIDQYIGQKRVLANLKVYVKVALKLEKSLDHIFISGNSGMGKTALAKLIASLMKAKFYHLNGTSLQKSSEIISVLTNLKPFDIIFIDEVHAVSKEVMEFLYPAIETGKITILFGKEYNAKTINLTLPNFTLIVATTELDLIPIPFYNRFSINFKLEDYSLTELGLIAYNYAQYLNLPLSLTSANYLATFSRNNPRMVLNLTKRINDFYLTKSINDLNDLQSLELLITQLGYYENGLTIDDLNYLTALNQNQVLGIENLSYLLNLSTKIITQLVEPWLLQQNYIIRTKQGRKITFKGQQFLEKNKNSFKI